jgi:transcriptional regulator with XRE-family HTH domain
MEKTGFGNRLKMFLVEKKLTQNFLATKISMKKQYLSRILKEEISPGIDIISQIFKALPDADCRWIITGEKLYTESILKEPKAHYGKCDKCEEKEEKINTLFSYISKLQTELEECKKRLPEEKRKVS